MAQLLRVLVVEDNERDAALLLRELRRGGYEIDHLRVETAETMIAALVERRWDLIVSDYAMPRFSARGALDVLTKSGLDLPFIIVSGTIGEEAAVEAMRAQGQLYPPLAGDRARAARGGDPGRAPDHRAAAAPGPEDGGDGPADRRRCP